MKKEEEHSEETLHAAYDYNMDQIRHKENQRMMYIVIYLVVYIGMLFAPPAKYTAFVLVILLTMTLLFFSMSVSREVDIAIIKEKNKYILDELNIRAFTGTNGKHPFLNINRNLVMGGFYWACFGAYLFFFMK